MQGDNISLAIDTIYKNEVVGIPTETVYGIGVNPNSKEAVEKLFELKERDDSKPISLLIPSYTYLQQLDLVTQVPEIVDLYWPGPLTAVVETNEEYVDGIGTKNPNTIGLRVPDNELTIQLLNEIGPLAVTSANTSGDEEAKNDSEAYEMFTDNIGYYLKGTSIHGDGSTVVDFRVTGGVILRQGPLKWPPSYC